MITPFRRRANQDSDDRSTVRKTLGKPVVTVGRFSVTSSSTHDRVTHELGRLDPSESSKEGRCPTLITVLELDQNPADCPVSGIAHGVLA
jgi:hypothetical protein